METTYRIRVVLDVPRTPYPRLLARSWTICNAVTAAPNEFPAPTPAMAVLTSQIQALDAAQKEVIARVPGSVPVRKAKAVVVRSSLEMLGSYVQGLCDANPAQAATLVSAAGMVVATIPRASKPILAATPGIVSGSAHVAANRGLLLTRRARAATFHWQYSLDGGKTWVTAPPTPLASTEIQGLPPLTVVTFRVCTTVGKTTGPWSQAVTLVVH